jgi:hypothetical protein
MDAGRSNVMRKGGAAYFSLSSMPRNPDGAVCIARPSSAQEINMSDSENQHQSSDQARKDGPEAESKASARQLPDGQTGKASNSCSIPANDSDDSVEAELEGRNSSNGNEVA